MLANEWHYCNDLQFFFGLKTALAIIALSFVTCTLSPVSLNLHPPRPEMVDVSSFLEPVGHSLRISADLLKPATQTCGWTFSPLFDAISFICEDKSILTKTGSTSFAKFKAKFFSHLLWSSGHRRLKLFPLNFWSLWNFLKSIDHCWSYEMDTDEYDLLDLKMVCYLLESGTDENLEETLSSLRERHSDRLRNKMVAKFRIDRSSLARDDFADVLINEVISNKVLSYSVSDSNSKLKVIGAKSVLKILYLIKWYGTWEPQFIFLLHQNVLMYQLLHSFRSFKTISQTWSDMSSEPD